MSKASIFLLCLGIVLLPKLLYAQGSLFSPPVFYNAGDHPRSVFSTDLDGDNDNDLAIANRYSNNISILLNDGDGTFQPHVLYDAGNEPHSIFSKDFNGDSDNDLAVANNRSNNVSILINNGDGTFQPQVTYGAGNRPSSIYSTDLDGDNDNDLAIANHNSDNISILLNDGDGTFQPHVTYPTGDYPYSIVSADFDGDNDNDLVVANAYSNNVSIFLNDGDGTFQAASTYLVGNGSYAVFSTDLDGDNDRDLVVTNAYSDNVSILLNDGDGTFQPHVTYPTGDYPYSIVSADFDGDNDNDLAVANYGLDNISILLNDGDGTFQPHVTYPTGNNPYSIFSADLDSDNNNDLAVANDGSDNVSILFNQRVKPLVLICGMMGTHLYERIEHTTPISYEEVWFNIKYAFFESFFDKLKMEEGGYRPVNQNICLNDPGKLMGESDSDKGDKNVYGDLIDAIEGLNGGAVYIRDVNFFTFPYDWRYDNTITKNEFNIFINENIPSGKFDVIAHSMGGLIVKDWAIDNPGRIRNCFFIATPHNGATEAFKSIRYGRPFGKIIVRLSANKIKELSRNMIPCYQLLPDSTYLTRVPGGIYCTQIGEQEPECFEDLFEFLPNRNFENHIKEYHQMMESPITNIENPYIIASKDHLTVTRITEKHGFWGKSIIEDHQRGDDTVPWFSTYYGQDVPEDNFMVFDDEDDDDDTKHSKLCNYPGTISYIFDKLGYTYIPPRLMVVQEPETVFKPVSYISGTIGGPIELDMYDNNGNHSGLNESQLPEFNIPGTNISCYENSQAFYYTDIDDITLEITGTGDGNLLCYITAHIDSLTSVTKLYEATHYGLPLAKGSIYKITAGFYNLHSEILCDYDGNRIFEDTLSLNYTFYNTGSKSAKQKKNLTIRNTPNPFNSKTAIEFELPEDTKVEITVYNVLGQRVETLVDDYLNAGQHSVIWDASNYSSGIYFYKLTTNNKTLTKRMTLLK